MDNRLCIFRQVKTGGCIMGKQIISQGQNFSPGQYNLEINFQFRNTGKKKNEILLPFF